VIFSRLLTHRTAYGRLQQPDDRPTDRLLRARAFVSSDVTVWDAKNDAVQAKQELVLTNNEPCPFSLM
jgi:hypothetical protein